MSADKMDLVYDKCCANLVLYNYTIEVDNEYAPLIPYYLTYKSREWLRKLRKKFKAVDMHNIPLIFHFNVIVSIYDISGK